MVRKVKTTCAYDCYDSCGMVACVREGKVVKLEGGPKQDIIGGFLCRKADRQLERLYSQERILHPLRKVKGTWQRISWDEALDIVAEKLEAVRQQWGSLAAIFVSGSGSLGILHPGRYFFDCFGGVTTTSGDLCAAAGIRGIRKSFGSLRTHDPLDLLNSRAIIIWGRNPACTNIHLLPILQEARRKGTKLVLIDPVRTGTARFVDYHLQPCPGSDGYLALGMAKFLLERNLTDTSFLARHTEHFQEYRKLVGSLSWNDITKRCDLPLKEISKIAGLYGGTKPGSILLGMGAQRGRSGADVFQLIAALGTLTGNIGVKGGGVNFFRAMQVNLHRPRVKDEKTLLRRTVPLPLLGEGIRNSKNPPLRMAWVAGGNPVNQAPNSRKVKEAFQSLEFCVVMDHFLTDTAECAHIFLPAAMSLEKEDMVVSYWHSWLGPVNPVVNPQGEAKSDLEIYQLLAERLGFGERLAGTPAEWLSRMIAPLKEQGISLEKLKE